MKISIFDSNGKEITTINDEEADYNHEAGTFDVEQPDGTMDFFEDPFSYLDDLKKRFVG